MTADSSYTPPSATMSAKYTPSSATMSPPYTPPPADAPALALVHPTPAELRRIWALHHHMWGPALPLDTYLAREQYLAAVPLARDGGNTPWMLTDGTRAPGGRPILASCETLRKPAVVAVPRGAGAGVAASATAKETAVTVVDGLTHGIASVFTDEQYRGRGYAGRMLRELGHQLKQWQATPDRAVHFSVLYSDIGKTYYARLGWRAYPSRHLSWNPTEIDEKATTTTTTKTPVRALGYHDLAELCPAQVALLRARVVRAATTHRRPAVAIAPDLDTMLWHYMREDYMTQHIFGRTPTVRGGLVTLAGGRRMWALWTRGYYGGTETTKGNTLYILHMAVEGEEEGEPTDGPSANEKEREAAFAALIRRARAEAAAWRCEEVQLWNPTALQQRLADGSGEAFRTVDRETGSIPSLMWYGLGGGEGKDDEGDEAVEWVGNEKFGWF